MPGAASRSAPTGHAPDRGCARPLVPCSCFRPLFACPAEKIAMRLDMRGEPQRVLARQPFGELRIAAFQRLVDLQMIGSVTPRPVFLMDCGPAARPHYDTHVYRSLGEHRP